MKGPPGAFCTVVHTVGFVSPLIPDASELTETAESAKRPVGRLAPSPTGHLHLGHARSFLIAWWHARSRGGRVVLRFEDLDGDRSRPEHIETALRDLEWLGLDWDGSPRVQSEGLARLNEVAERLHREGKAYPCVCTRGDIRTAQSAPQEGATEVRYPGTCRSRFGSVAEARTATGRGAGLRFVVSAGTRVVVDRFAGSHMCNPHSEIGDFLITRRDGQPAYQLAVVVDDASDGVTEVVRGDDLLSSAARQMLLLEALGERTPDYYHLPLVRDASGRRLAKREDDLSLFELRAGGTDARAIVEWVAQSAGMTASRPRASELIGEFAMARVPRESVLVSQKDIADLRDAR